MKWRTADGRTIDVTEMEDNHLGNSLRMLVRNGLSGRAFQALAKEARRRKLLWSITPWDHDGQLRLVPKLVLERVGVTGIINCDFDVDGEPCLSPAATWEGTAPRCGHHRADAHRFFKVPCDGCMAVKPLTTGIGDMRFCAECSTADGWLAFLVGWVALFLSWACNSKGAKPL